VSSTFPRTRRSRHGYSIAEVEEFLEDARAAYTAGSVGHPVINARAIRTAAFSMQKGGYSTHHVDSALERLEDAFATRERDHAFAQPGGDAAWYTKARSTAQAILDRLSRRYGARFDRVGSLHVGYKTKDVDAFADRLADFFQKGKPLAVEEVRTVIFRSSRGGYSETQVDLLLDTVTNVMLAVR
jgi:DivIVA domain-containing protein